MAINPNTAFVQGQKLTADNANRYPFGIVAHNEVVASAVVGAAEAVQITSTTFTAIANRFYKVRYFEPAVNAPGGAGGYFFFRLRLSSLTGTQYQQMQVQNSGATSVANFAICERIFTLPAGSTTIVATAQANAAGGNLFRASNQVAYLIVEDLGPA
jgi:hypothetical protein